MCSGMKSEHHPPPAAKVAPLDDELETGRDLKNAAHPCQAFATFTHGRKLLMVHAFHPHSRRSEKRPARQMAALGAMRGGKCMTSDAALVAPEAYVTKPRVWPCLRDAAPAESEAEGLVRNPDAVP